MILFDHVYRDQIITITTTIMSFRCMIDTELKVDDKSTVPFFAGSYYEVLSGNEGSFVTTITDVDDVSLLRLITMTPARFIEKVDFLQGNADELAQHLIYLAGLISSSNPSYKSIWELLVANDFATNILDHVSPRIKSWREFHKYWNIDDPNIVDGLRLCCRHDPGILVFLIFHGHHRLQLIDDNNDYSSFIDLIIDNDMVSFTDYYKYEEMEYTPLMSALITCQSLLRDKLLKISDIAQNPIPEQFLSTVPWYSRYKYDEYLEDLMMTPEEKEKEWKEWYRLQSEIYEDFRATDDDPFYGERSDSD